MLWASPSINKLLDVGYYLLDYFAGDLDYEKQLITTSAVAGTREAQRITVASGKDNLGGYFQLSSRGYKTGNIKFNAPAEEAGSVREALT
jgi:hypothetical protein